MPKPILTPQQIAEIQSEKVIKSAKATALTDAAAAQTGIIAHYQAIDAAYKEFFDWYNDSIIGKYDAERKSIEGKYVASPVVESDIAGVGGNPASGRLAPTPPTVDIVRIPEFDGGPLVTTTINETQHITDQIPFENELQFGYPGTDATVHATHTKTATSLTALSITLEVTDNLSAPSFAVGNIIEVEDGTTSAVLQVTSVTDTTPAVVFPAVPSAYTFTLGIIVLIPPVGSVGSGANVKSDWHGFNNAERTAKTPAFAPYQNIMDVLISRLIPPLNARLARLAEQLIAINANEDPDGVTTLVTAKANATASQTFLTNYLIGLDISDAGFTGLVSERTGRSTYLTARVTEITSAYTGQTINYYNARYDLANNRGNTQRGSLREQSNAASAQSVLTSMVGGINSSIAAYDQLLSS